MELLLFSALGQQNGQQSGDSEPAKSNEQMKNDKIGYLNNRSSSPMQREANKESARDFQRDTVGRENLRENLRASESARDGGLRENRGNSKDLSNLSKQATLAALVASMGQFSNQITGNQLTSNQLPGQLTGNPTSGNQLNPFTNLSGALSTGLSNQMSSQLSNQLSNQLSKSAPHANSLHPSGQFINSQLISNQFSSGQLSGANHSTNHQSSNPLSSQLSNQLSNQLSSQLSSQLSNQLSGGQLSDAHLLNSQQMHNSLTFDNVKNLLLNQRKSDAENIFSGGFQNLLTSLSVGSTNETGFQQSTNTIASPNWRPIRTNAQNIITSAKQSGPASWIDRSKLGKVAAQSRCFFSLNAFKRKQFISRLAIEEVFKNLKLLDDQGHRFYDGLKLQVLENFL